MFGGKYFVSKASEGVDERTKLLSTGFIETDQDGFLCSSFCCSSQEAESRCTIKANKICGRQRSL